MNLQTRAMVLLKGLVISYLVTALILVILAAGIWKFDFSETMVNIGMIAAYILSALAGGYYLGKKMKEKKYLWGIALGIAYIIILLATAVISGGPAGLLNRNTITTAFICILSGMLGGMLG